MTAQWHTLDFNELSNEQLYALLQLRQDIFVVEQDCVYADLDGLDKDAVHMLYLRDGELAAYQRCLAPGVSYAQSSIGRIAVAESLRGQQMGRELVQRGIDFNFSRWPDSDIRINAQAHLQDFYASLGFVGEGDIHVEDGIPHRQMQLARPG